jgi:DNA topoisomerase-3
MARAELLTVTDAVFDKEGKQIPYRTVRLTPTGRAADQTTPVHFVMKEAGLPVSKRKRQKKAGKPKASRSASVRTQSRQAGTRADVSEPKPQVRVEEALRVWRLSEAKHRNIPAFRIFGDRRCEVSLRPVPGMMQSYYLCRALEWRSCKNMDRVSIA